MKKFFKLILKITVVLVLLAALGLVVLRLMYPPEKIKQMALSYAKNNLHREISFDEVSFNLIGVTLTNFALSEENSFEQGTFVKADRLEAKAALWPLLKKRVEISTLVIDGLDVNIQKNKDGSFNFDSLTAGQDTQTATPAQDTQAAPNAANDFALTAEHIRLTDADFYYTDEQTGLKTSVEDLNINLDNVDLDEPFTADVSFTSYTKDKNGPAVAIPVSVALRVFLANLETDKAYVEITDATATYKHVRFALKGKAENFKTPTVDLSGSLSGLDNTAFIDFLPDLPNFTLPTLYLTLKASADLDKSSAQITQAALRMQDSALSTSGQVNWGGEQTTYQLSGNVQADITQLVKMADDTGFDPKGTINGSFTATDKKDGQDIRGNFTLKNISALYPPFALTQTNGTIKINSLADISCSSLTGLLNGEKFTSSFAYKNIKDVPDITLKLNLDKLTLAKFPSFDSTETAANTPTENQTTPTSQTPETHMNVTADVSVGPVTLPHFYTEGITLQAALQQVSETMQKANGTLSFALQPGAITDIEKLLKQSKIVRILLLPLGLLNDVGKALNLHLFDAESQAKKGEIAIRKAEGKYTFTDGIMHIDTTTFESALTNLNASGTVNFATSALDMKASATVLTKQTPVVIKIGGTLDNPSGKLDVTRTVTSVVGGILSYQTAKSAVKGTAGAASSVATGAVKTTSQVATNTAKDTAKAAKATVKALGNLFKKSDSSATSTADNAAGK